MSEPHDVAFDLDALVDAWRGPLVGLLAARGMSWSDATELAEDVFAHAWMSRANFRGDASDPASVGPWLAGIARNLHRSARRGPRVPHVALSGEERARDDDGLAAEDERERARCVLEQVARLPDAEREAVHAFYLEEASTRRVAALLGTSERAVEGLLHRARKRLRAWLGALAEPTAR